MASLTAVELGADSCVLVRTSVHRGAIHASAVETLDPAAFPGVDAFTAALKHARRTLKLPRRCRAVVWGLPDGANLKDIAVQPLLAPLTGAGFRVSRVVSPCNALAALARVKSVRGDGATCWLAINRGGVAIVVVRPGKQLYSYSFAWDSSVGSSGSQARLLQRYSLVAILGPEVKRAMAEARKLGIAVEVVVTCGNLPDLRSLTMPLIEELDVEVETLDSLEGLVVKPAAAERLAELAPALRLACAGLIARGTRPWDEQRRGSVRRTGAALRFAAAAALVLVIGYAWYMRAKLPGVSTLFPRATDNRPVSAANPPWKPPAGTPKPAPSAVSVPAKKSEPNPPAVSSPPPAVAKSNPPVVNAKSTPPAPSVSAPAVNPPGPVVPARPKTPDTTAPAPSVLAKSAGSRGAVSDAAKKAESNPTAPESRRAPSVPAPAVSDPAKKTESNPKAPASRGAASAPPKPPAAPAPSVPTTKPESNPKPNSPVVNAKSAPPAPRVPPRAVSDPAKKAESNAPAVSVPAPAVIDARKKVESNPKRPESNPPAVSAPAKRAESNPPPVSVPAPAVSDAAKKAESNPKKPEANPPSVAAAAARAVEIAPRPSAQAPRAADPAPRVSDLAPPLTPGGLNAPTVPADKPEAARNRPLPALLKDPLPRVTTILVSSDRRFATIENGQIIAIGDVVGRRVVVAIDERTVVLREPSGVQIRVGLGGRVVAVGRSDR